MSLLLLFDIDGTLLLDAAAGHATALRGALAEVYGVDTSGVHLDPRGRTDPEIARILLLECGVDATRIDDGLHELHAVTARRYGELEADLSAHVAPGVTELLAREAARAGTVISLVTGNFEPVARLKLGRAGIGHFFAVGQGGFGSDSEDRTDLPAVARRRAGTPGAPWPRERTVIVGDTPLDIACARADGVRCAAVTTGSFTAGELAGADAVVASFAELPPVLEAWG